MARCHTRCQFLQVVLHSVPTGMCETTDTALQKVNKLVNATALGLAYPAARSYNTL